MSSVVLFSKNLFKVDSCASTVGAEDFDALVGSVIRYIFEYM